MAGRGERRMRGSGFFDLTGQRFGNLTAIRLAPTARRKWISRCVCGNETIVQAAYLRNGSIKSCGCSRKKHGHAAGNRSQTWRSWDSMVARCLRPANCAFQKYGGSGITICERWRSFEAFLEDMGERPEGTTLDRIDGSGNYEPSNCRWATLEQQNFNRRTTVAVEINGKMLTRGRAAAELGIHPATLDRRLSEHGDPHRPHSTERGRRCYAA